MLKTIFMCINLLLLLVLWGIPQAGAEEPLISKDLAASHLVMTAKDLDALAKELKQDYNAQLRVQLLDPPCLAKMEAAMRAMEPYLGRIFRFNFHEGNYWIERKLESRADIEKLFDTEHQWDAAKACWQEGKP